MKQDKIICTTEPSPDLAKYRQYVAHMGLPADEEQDLLVTIWRMMGSFVDRAHGDDPIQHVHEIAAKGDQRPLAVVTSGNTKTPDATLSSAFTLPAGRRKRERS